MKSNIPAYEQERLKALKNYDVLDSEHEEAFDEIVKLASIISGCPIALISLVDNHRQWFKAQVGIPDSIRETSREDSFCSHAILSPQEPFIVSDARIDEKFKDNPVVTQYPNIVFYAGFPLVTPDNYAIGNLCVLNTKPHELSAEQKEGLKILAHKVIKNLENRKNLKKMIAQNRLSALGEMSCGLAHEINNPLAIMKINLEILHDELKDPSPLKKINSLTKACERISSIINSLKGFASSKNNSGKFCHSQLVIKSALQAIGIISKHSKIDTSILDAYLAIDESSLQQVLVNCLKNSIEATANTDQKIIKLTSAIENDFFIIKILDSGVGVDSRLEERIFEPFFSSKNVGEGLGMGLPVAKGLLESYHGKIIHQKEEGLTCFKITIPLKKEEL